MLTEVQYFQSGILIRRPDPPLWVDLRDVEYQIKGNGACSNMVANIFPVDPTPLPDPGVGSKGQNATFFEHGHVPFQIKGDHKCSNIQAHSMFYKHPRPLGWDQWSKLGFFFLKEVMLHIKLMGMLHRAPCKHIFCSCTPRHPALGRKVKQILMK